MSTLLCPTCQSNLMEGVHHERVLLLEPTTLCHQFKVVGVDFCSEEWSQLLCSTCGEGLLDPPFDVLYEQLNRYSTEPLLGKLILDEELTPLYENHHTSCTDSRVWKDYQIQYVFHAELQQFVVQRMASLLRGGKSFVVCETCDKEL